MMVHSKWNMSWMHYIVPLNYHHQFNIELLIIMQFYYSIFLHHFVFRVLSVRASSSGPRQVNKKIDYLFTYILLNGIFPFSFFILRMVILKVKRACLVPMFWLIHFSKWSTGTILPGQTQFQTPKFMHFEFAFVLFFLNLFQFKVSLK